MQPRIPLFPEQASTMAPRVDNLYFFMLGGQRVLRRAGHAAGHRLRNQVPPPLPDEVGEPIHGSLALELIWTGIPFILAMVMFVWGAQRVFRASPASPDEALDIYAVGKQWMWKFQHREGQREINKLHVPVNTPVRMIITSEDVLHDLYFPVVPREDRRHPRALHPALVQRHRSSGTYHIFCAEYCGTRHSGMIGTRRRDAAGGLRGLARRRRDGRHARAARREAVHAVRLRHVPHGRRHAGAGRC